jgi:hypothetical protein
MTMVMATGPDINKPLGKKSLLRGEHKLPVAGTFPLDGSRWKRAGDQPDSFERHYLTPDEVAEKLGIGPLDEFLEADDLRDGTRYMWLNKGYVLVDPALRSAISNTANELSMAFMEMLTDGEVGPKDLASGTRAIYIHDGRYIEIEVL